MWPELFTIPGLNVSVHGFGLMMVLGFYLGMKLAEHLAKRAGLNPMDFSNAAILALISGVIGARLSHVAENFGEFTSSQRTVAENLWAVVNITSGGLTYYGGFLLAFPTLVGYAIWKKIPVRVGMDIIAPCLMIGLGFGRIGCFLNGCCYGSTCELPWAIRFPYGSFAYLDQVDRDQVTPPDELYARTIDGKRRLMSPAEVKKSADASAAAAMKTQHSLYVHPAQLYSAFTALLLAAVLWRMFYVPHIAGHGFALMIVLEGVGRYTLEVLRVEPPVARLFGYGLSFSMVLAMGLVGLGMLLWLIFSVRRPQSLEIPSGARAVGA